MMTTIKIDLERRLGTVDRKIYGHFIEHLGRCIYGGIFEEHSPLSDAQGFRRDVLEAVRGLRVPVLRWPGGNFVSGYHWQDGVGPIEQRPRRMDLAWHAEESNRFGTDEFMAYCRLIGAEPYLCINMGTGTLDEAQAWVEYCNGTGNTYWANLRRQNGHADPYAVKYWGLGNEMYGDWQIGALSAEDYVKNAREFAKVMKWTDPTIHLVSCGQLGWNKWDQVVLEGLAPLIDYHSIHIYTNSPDYYSNVLEPHQAEYALNICQMLIDRVRYDQQIAHPIAIAYDEWNVLYPETTPDSPLKERYTLADALAVATYLNIFIRHCQKIGMANLAQLVNVLAPIFTSPEGMFLQPIYHPLYLYAQHMQDIALDLFIDAPSCPLTPQQGSPLWKLQVAGFGSFKLLDAAATCDQDAREVTLAVVNRDRDHALTTMIHLGDRQAAAGIQVYEVNGADPQMCNSFEQPHAVDIQTRSLDRGGQRFEYTFPAHSLTLLEIRIAE
jgi:alpha-N-arabinofuranosidase